MMYDRMSAKDVGGIDTLHVSIDNIPYDLFWMKDLNYLIKIMANYGVLLFPRGQK